MTTTQTPTAQALAAALAEFRSAAVKLAQIAEARYEDLEAAVAALHDDAMEWTPAETRKIERLETSAGKVDEIAQVARDALSGLEVL